MQIRFITKRDDNTIGDYKLLGCYQTDNFDVDVKLLDYLRTRDIPLVINTQDIVDTDGDEYRVENVAFVVPTIDGELRACVEVYVE